MSYFLSPRATPARWPAYVGVVTLLFSAPLSAQTNSLWTGLISEDWFDGENWEPVGVPGAGGEVVINSQDPNGALVDGATTEAIGGLSIGTTGSGALVIQNGGEVISTAGSSVGSGTGSSGTVDVTGPGSAWSVTGSLSIGSGGEGELTIEAGGTVTHGAVTMGSASSGRGVVTVTGPGSALIGAIGGMGPASLTIGLSGAAELTIRDGGWVSNGTGVIGSASSGIGTATVTGADSLWMNGGSLTIGSSGAGELTIEAGGRVTHTTSTIGSGASGSGSVTVTGSGSTLAGTAGQRTIGGSGEGELRIEDGGTVTNSAGVVGSSASGVGTVTVSGTDSTWTNSGGLTIGSSGVGDLTIEAGGAVTNTTGTVGTQPSGEGTVTVTGAGSTWINSSTLTIGSAGAGELRIEDGGAVQNATAILGAQANSTGNVTVTGSSSSWTSSGTLTVGALGVGELTITDGGAVSNTGGVIGSQSSASGAIGRGTVIVSGADSTWSNSASLTVGGQGVGELLIEEGGAVHSTSGSIGSGADGSGVVIVTGAESTWVNSNTLIVGSQGEGELTITDGGSVSNTFGTIGSGPTGVGTVTVTGSGSTWTNGSGLTVGGGGTGELTIESGGTVTSTTGTIGSRTLTGGPDGPVVTGLGDGAVTVIGDGATWTLNGQLSIGNQGEGELMIADGGTVSNANAFVGTFEDSVGRVTVTGADSTWVNSHLTIGYQSEGELTISGGGAVSNADGLIGQQASGVGTVTVTGPDSTWTNSGSLVVGLNGTGELTIENGGTVTAENGSYVGNSTGSEGTVAVSGVGSSLAAGSQLTVGGNGTGTLIVEDGGTVSNTNGSVGYFSGTVTVRDTGSAWINSGLLTIGHGPGEGELRIENGATVTSTGGIIGNGFVVAPVGGGEASTVGQGEVTVTGADSAWNNEGGLTVGLFSLGRLMIVEGGTVTTAAGSIGTFGRGEVTVTGAASSLSSGDILRVGVGTEVSPIAVVGQGVLTIAAGGTVEAVESVELAVFENASGTINIGAAADQEAVAPGILDTPVLQFGEGTATLVFNHTGTDYVFAPDLVSTGGGTHALEHYAGVTTLGGESVEFDGTTTILGGTLIVNGVLGGALEIQGGALGGSGTVGSITVGEGGVLSPGNSIGTLNIAGDITLALGSTYEVEVDPSGTSSDLVHATGQAILEGGSVVHIGLEGVYELTSIYTILIADGGIDGSFGDVTSDFAFLDPTLGYGANEVTLTLERNDIGFAEVGETFNQIATGEGIDDLTFFSPGNELYQAVVVLDEDTARLAFDQLSGEIHASGQHVVNQAFAQYTQVLRDQGRLGVEVGRTRWITPLLAFGSVESDGNAEAVDWWTGGAIGGYGWLLGENGQNVAGVSIGYLRSQAAVVERNSTLSANGYFFGAYWAGVRGPLSYAITTAYASTRVATERRIGFGGFEGTAEAQYGSSALGISGELAYGFGLGGGLIVSPVLTLDVGGASHRESTETGAGAANLIVEQQRWTHFDAGLGLLLSSRIPVGSGGLALSGRIVWEHAFGDTVASQDLSFAEGFGGYSIRGADAGSDRLRLGVDAGFSVGESVDLQFRYDGVFSDSQQSHSASVGVNFRF